MNSIGERIPQPPTHFFFKNAKSIDTSQIVISLLNIAQKFDGICKLELPNEDIILVHKYELVNELCDNNRFGKKVSRPLEMLRNLSGDALFTAYTEEPNWGKAHRLLMPAFGPMAITKMLPEMLDIAEQLMLKIDRHGDKHEFNITEDFTRLTLDTIALCAFGYRFNSFYSQEHHPYIHSMVEGLQEASKKAGRLPFIDKFFIRSQRRFDANRDCMYELAKNIIEERKQNLEKRSKKDLLDIMLSGIDPITGEKLPEENIIRQLNTFLVAGHETTSGMLSFATYLLLKNPDKLKKAQQIVDEVLGDDRIEQKHLPKLEYLEHVLKESLRLYPTAPSFVVQPFEDTTLGGKYQIPKGIGIAVMISLLHRDPDVWENPETFIPERFTKENWEKMPPNCWKPFGTGQRACIGRAFALQEATIVLAMLLQRFDLQFADPDYELKIKETLTIKPENFLIKAKKRTIKTITPKQPDKQNSSKQQLERPNNNTSLPILILYGSNSGSSENFARQLFEQAEYKGFEASLATLDDYVNQIPENHYTIMVTASYNGKPTHNARKFVKWLRDDTSKNLAHVNYAILGCGHEDWADTYQEIPKTIDLLLKQFGANSFVERGEANAARNFEKTFEQWSKTMWSQLDKIRAMQTPSKLKIEILEKNPAMNAQTQQTIDRILRLFDLESDTKILVHSSGSTNLSEKREVLLRDVLLDQANIHQKITKEQLLFLVKNCPCPPEKMQLLAMSKQDKIYKEKTVLDILEQYRACQIDMEGYLNLVV